jgi:hypothetical protein
MRRPEQALQRAVVQYLQVAAPSDLFWTAINPVPGKTPAVAALSKALGLRAGVSDLIFIYKGQALFLELKADKGRESPAQRETSLLAAKAAVPTFICRSIDEVEGRLQAWGIPLKARAA